jgi:lipoprotein-anchoring transpeptidase ErfK/SrfK
MPTQAAVVPVGATIALADDFAPVRAPLTSQATPKLPADSPFVGAYKGSPESRLINIYRAIGRQQTDVALDAAASLTHDVPGFRLSQLVYADLLSARTGNMAGFGAASAATSSPAVTAELGQLRDEALQRLHALQERPPANQVPAEFILLPKAIHHAIAVDTTRSRLYLFENGAQGMRLVSDHYVSVGKQGVDKSVEGDERTPLGVYFVSDRVGQGSSLGPEFGAGAMQLNYPNLFDKLHGRSGSGIYLHGVPFNTYSRPPKDSDGCVTLANDELVMLMNTVPLHDTPVIITKNIRWVSDKATQVHRAEILDAVNHWQSVRAADDRAALDAFYAPGAAPKTPAAPPVAPPQPTVVMVHGKRKVLPAAAPVRDPIAFDNLSVLTWSDAKETMVVTFNERGTRSHRETVLRQYWERDAAKWKIVAEGTVR